jgi:biopolymer transport protein ExbD
LKNNFEAASKIEEQKKLKDERKISEDTLKARITRIKGAKNAPVVMIKAMDEATYKNLVDILDEMQICNIGRYAIVDITDYDKLLLKNFRKTKI